MKLFSLLVALLISAGANALEINQANRAQLEQLDGIGVVLADKMLKERSQAPFAGWTDLRKRVKGISGKRVQQWQSSGVTVNGERGSFTAVAPKAKDAGK
jgi:DNA polymerase III alpha subunit (gram-positive type)